MKLLGLVLVLWLALASSALATTYTPTRFDDPLGTGNCPADCSLRQVIGFAAGSDTIQLLEGTYTLTRGATLQVGKPLTILGAGRDMTVIDGLNNRAALKANRIMKITSGNVLLRDMTFKNGSDDADEYLDTGCSPCSTINFNGGGALYNEGGTVTVERVIFDYNRAPTGGAVATSSGTLNVTDSEFAGNGAAFGAGLFTRGGTITVDRTTFRDGGGTRGGGIYVRGGQVTVTNSTVANNGSSSTVAGGVTNQAGTLTLRNVTLAGNIRGGLETDTTGTTTVQNSILGVGQSDATNGSCVPSNQNSAVDGLKTGPPITTDLGNNISEDSTCPLTGPNSHPNSNAHLAPATFNGGVGYTAAPLFGSTAINGGNATACSPADQRGFTREGVCDIGAMEALHSGSPSSGNGFATDVTATGAILNASIDLEGEAGQLRFNWGTNSQELIKSTSAVGFFGRGTATVPFNGLSPNTTYYFQPVVTNATGESAGTVQSFKTPAGPPQVNGIELGTVTDTTAQLHFTLDPAGGDTDYVVVGGNGETAPVHVAANTPSQPYTATVQGLSPNTDYTLRVLATNSGGTSSPDGATVNLTTTRQVAGEPGAAVALDSEAFDYNCPSSATVDWGDATAVQPFGPSAIHCVDAGGDQLRITLTATHQYAAAGHYLIDVHYATDARAQVYAKIAAPAVVPTPTPTATPTDTPTPQVAATPTPSPTPVGPAPVFHQSVVVVPAGGTVLVKFKGTSKFVPLTAGQSVPLGSQIDVTKGKITLTSVSKAGGAPETADFYGGIFTVRQVGDVTDLVLSGPEPTCKKAKASAGKTVKKRSLWGDGKGKFRTSGKYSAATVRGTTWYVEDSCSGTLTKVKVGVVSVRDSVTRKTLTLRAGKHYLAKPKRR